MNRKTEIALAEELLALSESDTPYLDASETASAVASYTDVARYELELEKIFRKIPQPIAHASELPEPGSFIKRDLAGLPLLITRDDNGQVHIFLNVCRHRGTRLVDEHSGCKRRFSCPYHAWTWNNKGELLSIPGQQHGFPNIDKAELGLKTLGVVEQYGWVWVNPAGEEAPDLAAHLGDLEVDLAWIEADQHQVLYTEEQLKQTNWKLLSEGGLEAYHFKIAHRKTIGPYFKDNLSTYQEFNGSFRSILAKSSLPEMSALPREQWRLRDYTQIVYTLFPTTSLLVQSDHISWIQFNPIAVDQCQLKVTTLVPKDRVESEADLAHWKKNHQITVDTLTEDFDIAESIQSGLKSGANTHLTFGRFEGALDKLSQHIEQRIS
ncbi:MAG: SRPBCC family protein [Pseudomonadota bacterium]